MTTMTTENRQERCLMSNQQNISRPSRKTGFWHELKKNRAMFLMLLPGVLVLFLYNYLPMFGIIIAFKNFMISDGNFFSSLFKSEWIGFKNFEFLFSTPDAFLITRNTILYNLAFITSCTIIALAFAIMLNEIRSRKLSRFYQGSMFLPYFLSWVIASYLLYSFISPDKGFINMTLFKSLGLPPISWYTESKYWPYIIIIINGWKWIGNNCIIYLASVNPGGFIELRVNPDDGG
jgi:putative aldouronate transport system permease protein